MQYQDQLRLLCDTFRKCRTLAETVSANDLDNVVFGQDRSLGLTYTAKLPLPVPGIRYHYACPSGICYIYLLLPEGGERSILCIGPYLSQKLSHGQILEIAEKNGIAVQRQRAFWECLSALPVLSSDSHLFAMLDAFCEQLWPNGTFTALDANHMGSDPVSPIHQPLHEDNFEDVLLDMRTMEQRYAFENELIESVKLGQLYKQTQFFSAITNADFYEMRVADPVRNVKNYCIIMNTLLRKATEQGGVHPLYIDRVSSDFAMRIEQMTRADQSPELMQGMFRGYCTLVRQHTLGNYSHVVQTTILLIDSDLSANLTLHSLAQSQKISPGYLSTVFKKETGQTLTAYIRDKRMHYARYLLSTTSLQVQTVAMHCGILDVHYFSKLFKKVCGMTPMEYRESHK